MRRDIALLALPLAAFLVPQSASALTLIQLMGFFHVAVGLLLTLTILVFITGLGIYFARLNTWPSHRDHAVIVIQWAVVMLFVLLLLVALVNFFQTKPEIALPILAFIIVVAVAITIVRYAASAKGAKKEEH
jgi:hypothetical protein